MRKNADNKSDSNSAVNELIKCILSSVISFSVFLLLTLIINAASSRSPYIKENSKLMLYSALVTSSFINGLLCAVTIHVKAIVSSSVSAVMLSLMLTALLIVTNGFNFTVYTLINIAVVFVVSVVSAIIIKNMKR